MDKQKLIGALFVFFGAISYGILATIVKYANGLGMHISVLTFFQFFIGFIILLLINIFKKQTHKPTGSSKIKLIAWGTSLGMTTTLYYLSIQYIPVSIGIILLMQSLWISLILEAILSKKMPTTQKIIGATLCLIGTLFAAKIFNTQLQLDWRGLLLGLGAATTYTISIYSSSTIEKQYPSYVRSLYLVTGGLLLITLFWNSTIIDHLSVPSLYWGSVLALFGTIIPPLLFTVGIPKIGIGIGSVICGIEIPVSVLSAYFVLHEHISSTQWLGIFLILIAILIVNLNKNVFTNK